MNDHEALYPIREISRLTGVTPITLRAWERRYDLIEPVRTDTGHRLYTQDHVDYINQAVELTKQGIPISKVKTVIEERLASRKEISGIGDTDYTSKILDACHKLDYIETQGLVEQMFVDLVELQVKRVIVEVSIQLAGDDLSKEVLWQSVMVPILSARIGQGRRLLDKIGRKNIFLGAIDSKQAVLQRIMASVAIEAGYTPMLGLYTPLDNLIDMVKKLKCEAVLIVAPFIGDEDYQHWIAWAKKHPSIEVFLAIQDDRMVSTTFNFKVVSLFEGKLFD